MRSEPCNDQGRATALSHVNCRSGPQAAIPVTADTCDCWCHFQPPRVIPDFLDPFGVGNPTALLGLVDQRPARDGRPT